MRPGAEKIEAPLPAAASPSVLFVLTSVAPVRAEIAEEVSAAAGLVAGEGKHRAREADPRGEREAVL